MKSRFIFWDLDETLGYFRPGRKTETLKGIGPMLEKLQKEGCMHIVTTFAPTSYAESGLRKAGVRGMFDAVFGDDILDPALYNKQYARITERLGIAREDAAHDVMVVGNTERDIPGDLNLVTILHPGALMYSAEVLGSVISRLSPMDSFFDRMLNALSRKIRCSWVKGFDGLLPRGGTTEADLFFEGRPLVLENGVRVMLGRIKENHRTPDVDRIVIISDAPLNMVAEIGVTREAVTAHHSCKPYAFEEREAV